MKLRNRYKHRNTSGTHRLFRLAKQIHRINLLMELLLDFRTLRKLNEN